MKRRKVDNRLERQLLIALIVSKDFLSQAAPVLDKELPSIQDIPLFRLIADWCMAFWDEYNDAPRAHIETIYHSWADNENPEEELADSVYDLLDDLSGQYEQAADMNIAFLLDRLSEFLTKRKLQGLHEELDGLLSRGDAKSAGEVVQNYRTVELGLSAGIDPLNDDAAWRRAFRERGESLVELPGDAGKFFNEALARDSLVTIQAPEKRGKTFWLLELATRALRQRRKVAVFEVGDLSESQIMLRLGVRLAGIPLSKRYLKGVRVPDSIKRDRESEELSCELSYKELDFKNSLTLKDVNDARARFKRACGLPNSKSYIEFSVHPNSSINVRGIEAILDQWATEKQFVPDVIVIDYADILAVESERKESRDQVNDTWKALRRLSQERHALVLTATQANAQSYGAGTQSMKHFSNDKRKLAHVTGMFALNQTDDEKEAQVMRLNWIVLREAEFNIKRCLFVGNCLALGRSMTVATL